MKGSQIAGPVAKECADLWRAFCLIPSCSNKLGRPYMLTSLPALDPRGCPRTARIASNAGTVV